ncbi:uncharacterized protein LOC110243322 [Exaiptasia diaphana]|uniref:Uncharacterized protein n=1 Tax=Exaiptasia diaphana TaxID=2652724 RepID=A0A913XIZ4_EXADI|nr:uncharacterized protein LOC110243322 [Exaiptasia diaphana]
MTQAPGNTGMPNQVATPSHPGLCEDQKDTDESMECTISIEPVQLQESLHRSVQASTQMLYDVYNYTTVMLEELEKHEGRPGIEVPPNSEIFPHLVPLNHKKPKPEVIAGIEAELQCLSIQMRYLPKDVINDSTRKQMVEQTLKWLGFRQEMKVPRSKVEWYCKNILEIVLFGAAREMPPRKHPSPTEINSEQVNEAMFQMARGRYFGEQQDKPFHEDPNKNAELKPKRGEKMKVSLREGANRLPLDEHKDNDLLDALVPYVFDVGVDTT